MFGLELTTGQKVQCGFVMAMMVISGFVLVRNSRPLIDGSVNGWTLVRKHPADKSKTLGPANPADPLKDETVSVFICSEGQLEIAEYKKDPDRHPTLTFKPELRRGITHFKYYQDPMAPVAAVKDPYWHTLTLAAYTVATSGGKKTLGLLAGANLTPEQLKSETDFRTAMLNTIKVIQDAVELGTFHPDLMEKILAAVATYKDRKGDPQTDSVKADLARTVLDLAGQYMKKVEDEKDAAIDIYIERLDKLLTADQKAAVVKAGKAYMDTQAPHTPTAAPRAGNRGGRNNNNGTRSGPAPAVPSNNSPTRANRAGRAGTAPVAPAPAK